MLEFQWNAVRVGDRVAVHDDLDPGLGLHHGVVRIVRTQRPSANEVGIRIDGQDSGMLHPSRHAVHLLPIDPQDPCWRCEAVVDAPIDGLHTASAHGGRLHADVDLKARRARR